MKPYTKKTREAYNTRAAAILSQFAEYPEDIGSYSHRCMSDLGIISIVILPLIHGDNCADVCARVEDTNHPNISRFDVSLPSGKWNIVDTEAKRCLDAFEKRLRSINARPPTEDELAAWHKADETLRAERKKLREEYALTA